MKHFSFYFFVVCNFYFQVLKYNESFEGLSLLDKCGSVCKSTFKKDVSLSSLKKWTIEKSKHEALLFLFLCRM